MATCGQFAVANNDDGCRVEERWEPDGQDQHLVRTGNFHDWKQGGPIQQEIFRCGDGFRLSQPRIAGDYYLAGFDTPKGTGTQDGGRQTWYAFSPGSHPHSFTLVVDREKLIRTRCWPDGQRQQL